MPSHENSCVPEQRVQCWTERRELFMMQAYAIQKHPVG